MSCQSNTINEADIRSLNTFEKRNIFLEEIYEEDQCFRKQLDEAYDLWEQQVVIDSLNLTKIENYLNTYNYPDTINYTEKARNAPWFVIQHCMKIDQREKYFELLRSAFKTKKINEIKFYLYLSRNYYIQKGEMLGIENDKKHPIKEKINILLDSLKYK